MNGYFNYAKYTNEQRNIVASILMDENERHININTFIQSDITKALVLCSEFKIFINKYIKIYRDLNLIKDNYKKLKQNLYTLRLDNYLLKDFENKITPPLHEDLFLNSLKIINEQLQMYQSNQQKLLLYENYFVLISNFSIVTIFFGLYYLNKLKLQSSNNYDLWKELCSFDINLSLFDNSNDLLSILIFLLFSPLGISYLPKTSSIPHLHLYQKYNICLIKPSISVFPLTKLYSYKKLLHTTKGILNYKGTIFILEYKHALMIFKEYIHETFNKIYCSIDIDIQNNIIDNHSFSLLLINCLNFEDLKQLHISTTLLESLININNNTKKPFEQNCLFTTFYFGIINSDKYYSMYYISFLTQFCSILCSQIQNTDKVNLNSYISEIISLFFLMKSIELCYSLKFQNTLLLDLNNILTSKPELLKSNEKVQLSKTLLSEEFKYISLLTFSTTNNVIPSVITIFWIKIIHFRIIEFIQKNLCYHSEKTYIYDYHNNMQIITTNNNDKMKLDDVNVILWILKESCSLLKFQRKQKRDIKDQLPIFNSWEMIYHEMTIYSIYLSYLNLYISFQNKLKIDKIIDITDFINDYETNSYYYNMINNDTNFDKYKLLDIAWFIFISHNKKWKIRLYKKKISDILRVETEKSSIIDNLSGKNNEIIWSCPLFNTSSDPILNDFLYNKKYNSTNSYYQDLLTIMKKYPIEYSVTNINWINDSEFEKIDKQQFIELAEKEEENKNYEKAIYYYQRLHEYDKIEEMIIFQMAEELYCDESNVLTKTIQLLKLINNVKVTNNKIIEIKAQCLRNKGEYHDAIKEYKLLNKLNECGDIYLNNLNDNHKAFNYFLEANNESLCIQTLQNIPTEKKLTLINNIDSSLYSNLKVNLFQNFSNDFLVKNKLVYKTLTSSNTFQSKVKKNKCKKNAKTNNQSSLLQLNDIYKDFFKQYNELLVQCGKKEVHFKNIDSVLQVFQLDKETADQIDTFFFKNRKSMIIILLNIIPELYYIKSTSFSLDLILLLNENRKSTFSMNKYIKDKFKDFTDKGEFDKEETKYLYKNITQFYGRFRYKKNTPNEKYAIASLLIDEKNEFTYDNNNMLDSDLTKALLLGYYFRSFLIKQVIAQNNKATKQIQEIVEQCKKDLDSANLLISDIFDSFIRTINFTCTYPITSLFIYKRIIRAFNKVNGTLFTYTKNQNYSYKEYFELMTHICTIALFISIYNIKIIYNDSIYQIERIKTNEYDFLSFEKEIHTNDMLNLYKQMSLFHNNLSNYHRKDSLSNILLFTLFSLFGISYYPHLTIESMPYLDLFQQFNFGLIDITNSFYNIRAFYPHDLLKNKIKGIFDIHWTSLIIDYDTILELFNHWFNPLYMTIDSKLMNCKLKETNPELLYYVHLIDISKQNNLAIAILNYQTFLEQSFNFSKENSLKYLYYSQNEIDNKNYIISLSNSCLSLAQMINSASKETIDQNMKITLLLIMLIIEDSSYIQFCPDLKIRLSSCLDFIFKDTVLNTIFYDTQLKELFMILHVLNSSSFEIIPLLKLFWLKRLHFKILSIIHIYWPEIKAFDNNTFIITRNYSNVKAISSTIINLIIKQFCDNFSNFIIELNTYQTTNNSMNDHHIIEYYNINLYSIYLTYLQVIRMIEFDTNNQSIFNYNYFEQIIKIYEEKNEYYKRLKMEKQTSNIQKENVFNHFDLLLNPSFVSYKQNNNKTDFSLIQRKIGDLFIKDQRNLQVIYQLPDQTTTPIWNEPFDKCPNEISDFLFTKHEDVNSYAHLLFDIINKYSNKENMQIYHKNNNNNCAFSNNTYEYDNSYDSIYITSERTIFCNKNYQERIRYEYQMEAEAEVIEKIHNEYARIKQIDANNAKSFESESEKLFQLIKTLKTNTKEIHSIQEYLYEKAGKYTEAVLYYKNQKQYEKCGDICYHKLKQYEEASRYYYDSNNFDMALKSLEKIETIDNIYKLLKKNYKRYYNENISTFNKYNQLYLKSHQVKERLLSEKDYEEFINQRRQKDKYISLSNYKSIYSDYLQTYASNYRSIDLIITEYPFIKSIEDEINAFCFKDKNSFIKILLKLIPEFYYIKTKAFPMNRLIQNAFRRKRNEKFQINKLYNKITYIFREIMNYGNLTKKELDTYLQFLSEDHCFYKYIYYLTPERKIIYSLLLNQKRLNKEGNSPLSTDLSKAIVLSALFKLFINKTLEYKTYHLKGAIPNNYILPALDELDNDLFQNKLLIDEGIWRKFKGTINQICNNEQKCLYRKKIMSYQGIYEAFQFINERFFTDKEAIKYTKEEYFQLLTNISSISLFIHFYGHNINSDLLLFDSITESRDLLNVLKQLYFLDINLSCYTRKDTLSNILLMTLFSPLGISYYPNITSKLPFSLYEQYHFCLINPNVAFFDINMNPNDIKGVFDSKGTNFIITYSTALKIFNKYHYTLIKIISKILSNCLKGSNSIYLSLIMFSPLYDKDSLMDISYSNNSQQSLIARFKEFIHVNPCGKYTAPSIFEFFFYSLLNSEQNNLVIKNFCKICKFIFSQIQNNYMLLDDKIKIEINLYLMIQLMEHMFSLQFDQEIHETLKNDLQLHVNASLSTSYTMSSYQDIIDHMMKESVNHLIKLIWMKKLSYKIIDHLYQNNMIAKYNVYDYNISEVQTLNKKNAIESYEIDSFLYKLSLIIKIGLGIGYNDYETNKNAYGEMILYCIYCSFVELFERFKSNFIKDHLEKIEKFIRIYENENPYYSDLKKSSNQIPKQIYSDDIISLTKIIKYEFGFKNKNTNIIIPLVSRNVLWMQSKQLCITLSQSLLNNNIILWDIPFEENDNDKDITLFLFGKFDNADDYYKSFWKVIDKYEKIKSCNDVFPSVKDEKCLFTIDLLSSILLRKEKQSNIDDSIAQNFYDFDTKEPQKTRTSNENTFNPFTYFYGEKK